MTQHSRRDLLRFAALGAAAGSLSTHPLRAMCGRKLAVSSPDKLLVVFLRGAMDGLYTIRPKASTDSSYDTVRANLLPPTTNSYDLGAEFAGGPQWLLSDHFARLMDSGGPIANNHMRFFMRTGNPEGIRSHFKEWIVQETGRLPVNFVYEKYGMLARLGLEAQFDPSMPFGTVGSNLQQFFRHPDIAGAHIKRIADYRLDHEDSDYWSQDISGPMSGFAGQLETAMSNHHGQVDVSTTGAPGDIAGDVDAVGDFALQSLASIGGVSSPPDGLLWPADAQDPGFAAPMQPFQPGFDALQRCRQAIDVLEQTSASVMGVDIGGWDTHTNQADARALLDPYLAKALKSLYERAVVMTTGGHPTTILVVTEFGRTNEVNSNNGTDHGVGGMGMALGPMVAGQRKVSSSSINQAWLNIDQTSMNPLWKNALEVTTDFRMIWVEYFLRRFNLTAQQVRDIIGQPIAGGLNQLYNAFV